MNRLNLIYLAHKYKGEYDLIRKAIENNEELKEENDKAITIFDPEYPKCLLDLNKPPFVLFYKGNVDLLKEEKISVVGSREACEYALKATRDLCLNNKSCVVSGLAKGIDRQAHIFSLKSIGVLGCGINYIYPYNNKDLIEYMAKHQLIISEYPNDVKPLGYHFPFRNRIIASLSEKVYIMQSKEKSGTYTTVLEALELGKEVRVLPYDIYSEYGDGNNSLIQEGANIIEKEELGII